MEEIGGYIELDTYKHPILHEDAIALNCGRNCLAYLIKSRNIKKILLPYFICQSIPMLCEREQISIRFYHINNCFRPADTFAIEDDEWLYLINYYGQYTNEELLDFINKYKRVIVDNANSYFQDPLENVDTIYTCRKYFGVADGAFLYTNSLLSESIPTDESFERMHFLLGRYERTANEFYTEYVENNRLFINEPIKRMSKLTMNLLHAIDYEEVKKIRLQNFDFLDKELRKINRLSNLKTGTFMYPLLVNNGVYLRKKLQAEKIYIPILWPKVFELTSELELEYQMAQDILPLPIDQRYGIDVMEYIVKIIFKHI